MDETKDPRYQDPMAAALQNSIIAGIRSDARATLNEPTRPETPGDGPRRMFAENEYSDRPGSSYGVKSMVDKAAEEFKRAAPARPGKLPQL